MILVFGKTGQVATELQRQADVTALGRSEADLSDPVTCKAAILDLKPRLVINAAAYTAVDKAEEEEDLANVINGVAPGAMAEACASLDAPFVHISTDYVFDGSGEALWRPSDATGPLGAYGRSKLVGEQAVQAAGGAHAILRTAWVFSAHGGNFLKTMLRLSETRDHLTIVADQIGGPTPALGIAQACLAIAEGLEKNREKSDIYHYSGAPDVSWADFAREIFTQAGKGISVEDIPASQYPTPAKRPSNSRLDCASLLDAFGINRPDWKAHVGQVLEELGAKA